MTDAIPAATVVIFRERAAAPPELLMVERAKAMAFAGGALVFPGGRIDPGDHVLADLLADAPEDAAARIAAIRETIEETGIAIGLVGRRDGEALTVLRRQLVAGIAFAEAIDGAGLTVDLAALTPFARWRPAHAHARIFDTRFYLAKLPDNSPEPEADNTENVRVFWASAAAVLADADAGRATIIFPTWRNLERLARFSSFDQARADALRYPIRTITPWVEQRGGGAHLCIDDDLGYPVTAELLTRATRG